MKIEHTFTLRRYWLSTDTPQEVLNTLNYHWGQPAGGSGRPYVDVPYMGQNDRVLTLMELKYSEHIHLREELSYTVEGDDGL